MLLTTLIWLVFFSTFYLSHKEVWGRSMLGAPDEKRVRRDRSSDLGMALQFCAVALVMFAPGPMHGTGLVVAGAALAAASIWFVRSALVFLGRQWRVQAVIAEGHQLITDGPYKLVRHPIYLAFLDMVAATAMMRGQLAFCAAALMIFLLGTEIRVFAEERLLRDAFGDDWVAYKKKTKWAYMPGVR